MARKKAAKRQEQAAQQAAPAKAGGISTRMALGIGILVLGGLAVVSGLRGEGEPGGKAVEPAGKATGRVQATDSPRAPVIDPHNDPHNVPLPATDAGAAKLRQTGAIWAAFDKLPAGEKTKARLTDALDAAAQVIKAEPRAESDRANLAQQGVEFRKRAAPLASPGARATGDSFAVLVPSDDPARCLALGQAWSADGANMASLGFRRIECAGSPPKVWELKP